jgi:hypothetical protein
MKLHKGLSVYLVRDKIVAQELRALAQHEGVHLVQLNDELMAAEPEQGRKLCDILRKRGYFPRPISQNTPR